MKSSKHTHWQKMPLGAVSHLSDSVPDKTLPHSARHLIALAFSLPALAAVISGFFYLSHPHATPQISDMPDECHFLSHLALPGQYQQQKDGSLLCQSPVRYLGINNQHSLRYMARGQAPAIEEMRISLRLGEYGKAAAIDELIRYGQSLALPVLGHTMPAEVGQYLRGGHVGHWDFPQASLYIERQRYPVQKETASGPLSSGFEDIELVFMKNRIH